MVTKRVTFGEPVLKTRIPASFLLAENPESESPRGFFVTRPPQRFSS
jgi:hypothetical protein